MVFFPKKHGFLSVLLLCASIVQTLSMHRLNGDFRNVYRHKDMKPSPISIEKLRGGDSSMEGSTNVLSSCFHGGTGGEILGLTAVASAIVTPLTLYRQAYSFSIGYAFSISAMGGAMLSFFSKSLTKDSWLLASALVFYGIRLGVYLSVRQCLAPAKRKLVESFETTPKLIRIPFAVMVSLLYALMALPGLYACKRPGASRMVQAGAGLAWLGNIVEAITDQQKVMVKLGQTDNRKFEGPSNGWYGISRHPNYLAEIVFWMGILLGGAPGLGKNLLAWGCSLLGFGTIFKIMIDVTDRVEKKQQDNYNGQSRYEEWKTTVPKLIPKHPSKSLVPLSISIGLTALAMNSALWVGSIFFKNI